MGKKISNKRIKAILGGITFNKKFLDETHTIVDFTFPILTCWNCELDCEQFASVSGKTISLTAKQMRMKNDSIK